MANIGIVTALVGRDDAVFADRLNHASLNDAALSCRAPISSATRTPISPVLETCSRARARRRKLVVTDAVFSMDGDIAPVPELRRCAERHDAWLLLDDAHGFGVLGATGGGVLQHFGVTSPRIIYMATLGKAAGVFGAFVAGEPDVIETLVQRARTYIYTTATPPLAGTCDCCAVSNIMAAEDWRRKHLRAADRRPARRAGGHCAGGWCRSRTAIQPLVIGDNEEAMRVSRHSPTRGLLVPAIRPPTVPRGTARLRISLSAAHAEDDVQALVEALRELQLNPDRATPAAGHDLVLLHGWGTNAGVWDELASSLARDFRVHAVDLPGYAEAAPPARRYAGSARGCPGAGDAASVPCRADGRWAGRLR